MKCKFLYYFNFLVFIAFLKANPTAVDPESVSLEARLFYSPPAHPQPPARPIVSVVQDLPIKYTLPAGAPSPINRPNQQYQQIGVSYPGLVPPPTHSPINDVTSPKDYVFRTGEISPSRAPQSYHPQEPTSPSPSTFDSLAKLNSSSSAIIKSEIRAFKQKMYTALTDTEVSKLECYLKEMDSSITDEYYKSGIKYADGPDVPRCVRMSRQIRSKILIERDPSLAPILDKIGDESAPPAGGWENWSKIQSE